MATLTYNNTGNLSGTHASGNPATVVGGHINFYLDRSLNNPYRTEISFTNGAATLEFGREYWIGIQYRLNNWGTDKSQEVCPMQLHVTPSAWTAECQRYPKPTVGNFPFFMRVQNGVQKFHTYNNNVPWQWSVVNNSVETLVIHTKISTGSDGYIELWRNGTRLGIVSGRNSPLTDGCGKHFRSPYMKTGVYKRDWETKSTDVNSRNLDIFYIKIANGANGYSDVTGGGTPDVGPTPDPVPDPPPITTGTSTTKEQVRLLAPTCS